MYKKCIRHLLMSMLLLTAGGAAVAQVAPHYPSRPITLVVPYAAGGPADVLGRMVAEKLSAKLGQPIITDNRPGAGGHVGGRYVAQAAADGYILMLGTIAHHGASMLYKNIGYDPSRDLKTIALVAESPSVLLVNAKSPAKSVQDILTLARKNPGKLTYASAGKGSAMHMAAELFKFMADVDVMHVPYKGGAPAMTDLLGGQVDMLFENLGTAHPHIKSGKVRPLAVTSTKRSPSLPDIPTIAESGVSEYASVPWYTIAVARNVPDAVVEKLNTEINAVLRSSDLVQRWNDIGVVPVGGSVADAAARNVAETKKWTAVITSAKLTDE